MVMFWRPSASFNVSSCCSSASDCRVLRRYVDGYLLVFHADADREVAKFTRVGAAASPARCPATKGLKQAFPDLAHDCFLKSPRVNRGCIRIGSFKVRLHAMSRNVPSGPDAEISAQRFSANVFLPEGIIAGSASCRAARFVRRQGSVHAVPCRAMCFFSDTLRNVLIVIIRHPIGFQNRRTTQLPWCRRNRCAALGIGITFNSNCLGQLPEFYDPSWSPRCCR